MGVDSMVIQTNGLAIPVKGTFMYRNTVGYATRKEKMSKLMKLLKMKITEPY